MGGRRPLREQTVVTLDRDFTDLGAVTNLRIRHTSSYTSQISLRSQIFVYVTNLVGLQIFVYVTNLVQFTNIRVLHRSRTIHKYSSTSQISLRRILRRPAGPEYTTHNLDIRS